MKSVLSTVGSLMATFKGKKNCKDRMKIMVAKAR